MDITPVTRGAAAILNTLTDAEHEANRARLDTYDAIMAPLFAAREAAFAAHGAGQEVDAAHAALVAVVNTIAVHEPTHPEYAAVSAAHDAARAAVPVAALEYLPALLPALRAAHAAGGCGAGGDLAAIIESLPEGPIPGFQGWRKVTVSPRGAWNSLREVRLCYGRSVVAAADNSGECWVTAAAVEAVRLAEERARSKANHDAYNAQLGDVREALAVDPDLRGALLACYEGATLARACLALDGWIVREGQEGGTITPPWGGAPVSVRGALRLPMVGR